MAEKTLEQLRSDLVQSFNNARNYGEKYSYNESGAEYFKAAAQLANAIVNIDDKIDRRNEDKNGMKLPGKAA